jgi:predicted RNA-binding protein YlqC (UPF0109 family)
MSSIDQQFVEYIVKSLVGKPDAVHIDRRVDDKGVLLELTVDPEDLGRIIGKRGATAQSLRTLLRALGTKNEERYNLKIVDNGPEDYERPQRDNEPRNETPRRERTASDDDNVFPEEKPVVSEEPAIADDMQESDLAKKTRRELEDLDDLDI